MSQHTFSAFPVSLQAMFRKPGATLWWRNGAWHVECEGAHVKLSAAQSAIIGRLKDAGKLTEITPGYFAFVPAAPRPLQCDAESPLARLALMRDAKGKPVLETEQLEAGERLRADYERACLAARVTAHYEPQASVGGGHWQSSDNAITRLNDGAIAARQRLHAALDAVGPELSGILYHVCCLAAGLEQAEMRLALPRRAGKAVLLLALSRLARHYGLKRPLRHAGPSHIGHWAEADYRPAIMPREMPQPQHQP